MDVKQEVRDFLVSRRSRVTPEKAGLLVVGDLTVAYESMALTADTGLRLNAYVAEPGTPSAQALVLLGSWSATPVERKD